MRTQEDSPYGRQRNQGTRVMKKPGRESTVQGLFDTLCRSRRGHAVDLGRGRKDRQERPSRPCGGSTKGRGDTHAIPCRTWPVASPRRWRGYRKARPLKIHSPAGPTTSTPGITGLRRSMTRSRPSSVRHKPRMSHQLRQVSRVVCPLRTVGPLSTCRVKAPPFASSSA
jgi:hypothetical protein